jgi:hypothetical protein
LRRARKSTYPEIQGKIFRGMNHMPSRFSFDGALMFWLRAAHARRFLWVFPLAFAGAFTVFGLAILIFAKDDLVQVFQAIELLERASVGRGDPQAVFSAILCAMEPLVAWAVLAMLGSWIIWAMFEAASQRRYVRDERFSLGFGGDEVRIMAVGFCWAVMQTLFTIVPVLMIFGAVSTAAGLAADGVNESQIATRIVGTLLGALGLWLALFIVYAFFATRLAPCFGLTIKDKAFRFFDAWNVSRGRFWPILGAYLIITVVGGIAVSIADQFLQLPMMFMATPAFENVQTGEDVVAALMSGGVIVALAIYMIARLFLSGLLLHVAGAPAAFAARHDPRGSVDDTYRVDTFN